MKHGRSIVSSKHIHHRALKDLSEAHREKLSSSKYISEAHRAKLSSSKDISEAHRAKLSSSKDISEAHRAKLLGSKDISEAHRAFYQNLIHVWLYQKVCTARMIVAY